MSHRMHYNLCHCSTIVNGGKWISRFGFGPKFGVMQTRGKTRFAYPEGMVAYEDHYVDKPDYPPINPETRFLTRTQQRQRQELLDWQSRIKAKPSVEEKLIEMNVIRRYGWRSQILEEDIFAYDSLPLYRYITRTHIVSDTQLPQSYSTPELTEKVKHLAELVKQPMLDAIRFEMSGRETCEEDLNEWAGSKELKRSQSIVSQLNRILLAAVGEEASYLQTCQVDSAPNLEAFWIVGGMEPSRRDKKSRTEFIKMAGEKKGTKVDAPVERNMQYFGSPLLQVRCEDPIANFVDPESEISQKGDTVTNRFNYDTKVYGIHTAFKFGSTIPGHWTGDKHRSNLISFHPRHHLLNKDRIQSPVWVADMESALQSQAMLVSFARLLGQALYYGFDQFSDLSYPFSTQTVITNGLEWSFFAYQLNTMKLDKMNIENNKKQNLCWGTKSMKIFEEGGSEKLNTEVVENLLKFYLNTPTPILAANANITPHLKRDIADCHDEREKAIVHFNLRNMLAQKQDSDDSHLYKRFPEVYAWEKIYKIFHKMRPMDPRRRYFELPSGFPGSVPYREPYLLRDPTKDHKAMRRMKKEVEAKKEQEKIEAAKAEEILKFTKRGEY